jgi:hypothetical protein
MNKSGLYISQIIIDGLLALFTISLPFWADIPNQGGLLVAVVLALLFSFLAFKNVQEFRSVQPEEVIIFPATEASAEKEANTDKIYEYIVMAAFPALTLITIWDLNELEAGIVENVRLWTPLAFLYENFGYWATVLFIPLIGMFVIYVWFRE